MHANVNVNVNAFQLVLMAACTASGGDEEKGMPSLQFMVQYVWIHGPNILHAPLAISISAIWESANCAAHSISP